MKKQGATKTATRTVTTTRTVRKSLSGQPPRLYVRATFTGFRKGKTTQSENQALLKIEGLNDRKEVPYYLGKRVVYVYKTTKGFKSMWGRVASAHGNNGAVKAHFKKNLPPKAIGATLRVMLYPQRPVASN